MYALIFWCKNVTLFLHVHSWYSRSTWRINAHLGWCRHHQYQRSYLLVFFLRVDYPATRRNDFGPDGGYRRQVKLGETMCHHVGKSWCEVMYCDLMNMWWLWRLWGWSGVLCCAVVWCACIRGPGATEAWECLETLQQTAPAGSEVIRLVGNHGEQEKKRKTGRDR